MSLHALSPINNDDGEGLIYKCFDAMEFSPHLLYYPVLALGTPINSLEGRYLICYKWRFYLNR